MSCETARILMETNDPHLAEHMASCPSCIVQSHARYYTAPAGLEEKIRRSLQQPQTQRKTALPWRSLAIAATVLLAVSAGWNVMLLSTRPSPRQVLTGELLSAHVRSLSGTHLLDVPSSDHHTVKPWFNGKLDFSPAVKDFDGFPLLGGRLEYIDGHPAAALVYGRRSHIINVFTWPAASAAESNLTRNGYHVHSWWAGGMAYTVVSDLGEPELAQFVSLYRHD